MTACISVIIPTYNRWPVIRRAVTSVLAQTVPADELIVIDDGSVDGTVQKLENEFGDTLKFIGQSNQGVSAARNSGIASATGNWIALLDSDDEWLPEKLQQQRDLLEHNDDCVLCHTNEIWIRNGVRVNPMNKHRKYGGDIFTQCLPLCAISPSSVLIKKDLFSSVGMFDETLPACEDYDLWLRICATHKVHYLQTPLLKKYGGHADQLSRKHWGMDRFRVRSLHNLLTNSALLPQQRQQTLNMLEKKAQILLKGAIKHDNQTLKTECLTLLQQHNLEIPESLH